MKLRDLEYLVSVAKNNHFGNAAKECFVSQPALSMQIQKLESSLGVTLFERNNKNIIITDVGKKIVKSATIILNKSDEIKEIAKYYSNPFAGAIKLGAFPTLAPYFFPKIIKEITNNFPDLKIYLLEEKTEILVEKLKNGQIDAAFLANPLPNEEESLVCKDIFIDEFLLAVSKKHPYARLSSIDTSYLKNQTLMLLEEGHCLRDQALDVCHLNGATENDDFKATSLETLRQMVANNLGITLIPKIAQQKNGEITYLTFNDKKPKRKISLYWRGTSPRENLFERLIKILSIECFTS